MYLHHHISTRHQWCLSAGLSQSGKAWWPVQEFLVMRWPKSDAVPRQYQHPIWKNITCITSFSYVHCKHATLINPLHIGTYVHTHIHVHVTAYIYLPALNQTHIIAVGGSTINVIFPDRLGGPLGAWWRVAQRHHWDLWRRMIYIRRWIQPRDTQMFVHIVHCRFNA